MPFLSLHQYALTYLHLHALSPLHYDLSFSHSLSSLIMQSDSTKCQLLSITLSTPIWSHFSLLHTFSLNFLTKMDRRKHDRATPMSHYGSMQVKLNLITEKQ
ncbi:hypothetical protein AMTRI_Chr02g254670 [Amborella trichopoda]